MPLTFAQYVDGVLRPHSQATAEDWAKLSRFEVVRVKVSRGRNAKFNSLYRALLDYTCKALAAGGTDTTPDDLHKEIKIHLGYYRIREMPEHIARQTGRTHEVDYISTGFESMSEDEFRDFVKKTVDVIESDICPYLGDSEYAAKVDKIIAGFRQ